MPFRFWWSCQSVGQDTKRRLRRNTLAASVACGDSTKRRENAALTTAGHSGMVWTARCDNFENFSSYVGLSENRRDPQSEAILDFSNYAFSREEKVENPLELWGNHRLGTSIYSSLLWHSWFPSQKVRWLHLADFEVWKHHETTTRWPFFVISWFINSVNSRWLCEHVWTIDYRYNMV